LEDPVENIGAKLVRQAAAKTNDLAGDGTTTSVVLAQGFIAEGVKVVTFFFQLSLILYSEEQYINLKFCIFQVVAAGANPVLITRGIEKTAKALVNELKLMSKEVSNYYAKTSFFLIFRESIARWSKGYVIGNIG